MIGTTNFPVGGTVADNTPVKKPETNTSTAATTTQQATTTPVPTVTKSTRTEPSTDAVASKPSKAKVTSTPAPESGITFKVQITAAHREVGKPYFVQRHRYDGDFSIERNDGWIKYVTGMFDRYRAARDQRQAYLDANYNFPGPFVTAYNTGDPIPVQAALMIAKQSAAQGAEFFITHLDAHPGNALPAPPLCVERRDVHMRNTVRTGPVRFRPLPT